MGSRIAGFGGNNLVGPAVGEFLTRGTEKMGGFPIKRPKKCFKAYILLKNLEIMEVEYDSFPEIFDEVPGREIIAAALSKRVVESIRDHIQGRGGQEWAEDPDFLFWLPPWRG